MLDSVEQRPAASLKGKWIPTMHEAMHEFTNEDVQKQGLYLSITLKQHRITRHKRTQRHTEIATDTVYLAILK